MRVITTFVDERKHDERPHSHVPHETRASEERHGAQLKQDSN
jgi:hypothetical protein